MNSAALNPDGSGAPLPKTRDGTCRKKGGRPTSRSPVRSVIRELGRECPKRLIEFLAFADAGYAASPIAADAHALGVTHVAVTTSNQVLLNLCVEGTYVEQLGCPAGNVTIVSLH
mgnify:CR=1 FL=1